MAFPQEGDMAPGFTLPATSGTFSLEAHRGRPVVLFFYPRDDTAACTAEAIDFSAAMPAFKRLGAIVAGVSADTVRRHERFACKHGLRMDLVSDESTLALQAWGVWVEKQMYGRSFMGVERSTFLIDRNGLVARAWRKVRVPGHVAEVMEALRALPR